MYKEGLVKTVPADKATVAVYESRKAMGYAAAQEGCAAINDFIAKKGEVSVLFACAVSQTEFFEEIFKMDIDWSKVNGFVMDEYAGVPKDHPALLANFAKRNIYADRGFKNEFIFDGSNPDLDAEARRYSDLLTKHPLDIVFLGIGENGHLAYNDPHVADFNDPLLAKPVVIDEMSRVQAVHDGTFATAAEAPEWSLTVTMPAMTNAPYKMAVVPGPQKAEAIRATVQDEISTKCPASILRNYDCIIYTEVEGASKL